jgi:hypothetical protein
LNCDYVGSYLPYFLSHVVLNGRCAVIA